MRGATLEELTSQAWKEQKLMRFKKLFTVDSGNLFYYDGS